MIILKSEKEIEKIRECGRIVARVLDYLSSLAQPGITTDDLDEAADRFIREHGGSPSFKGYKGFPKSICTSIDDEVVHGVPRKRKLREGEILSLDVGVYKHGYHGDSALTIAIGAISEEKEKLLRVTREALYKGIEMGRQGLRLMDISHAIQSHVEANGFSVVRELVGHGIGKDMHEDPQIPNYGLPGQGPRLAAGMVLAIEPMVNKGGPKICVKDDNWTIVTQDRSPSAHFEHTIAITENGPVILTVE
ncbi:MAG: type I methionyl aminopeptidase [Armatimonadetes bacterium]|nr:type I methionyl aminopeptidase [Armatimonadota bacterium]